MADVAATETEITAEAAVGEGEMVQTPTPHTKTDRKLGASDRTDAKKVGQHIWDGGLRGMGKPPWGQPSALTGEGGDSHLAPTEEGETSVGPDISAHRRRWGQPFGAHRRRWGQPSSPTGHE